MTQTPALTTKRLLLRPLELSDAARIQLLFPHWEIVRHLAAVVPWPYPKDGALTYLRDVVLPAVERGSEWYWSICLGSSPAELIGVIGLADNEHDNRGFWLGLSWHRQGLMTEAVAAVNDFWFTTLGRPVMRVQKAEANQHPAASRSAPACRWLDLRRKTLSAEGFPLKFGSRPARNILRLPKRSLDIRSNDNEITDGSQWTTYRRRVDQSSPREPHLVRDIHLFLAAHRWNGLDW